MKRCRCLRWTAHNHDHRHDAATYGRAIGISLNLAFVVVEFAHAARIRWHWWPTRGAT